MSIESCDSCHDTDADNYYDCDNCYRHLCARCYGDITLNACKACVKDPEEGKALAQQKGFEPKGTPIVSFPIDIRHYQVIPFAKAMDEVLTKNDHKGGWQDCGIQYLRHRLVEEINEYFALASKPDSTPQRQQKELLDIANFCMMLWDRE